MADIATGTRRRAAKAAPEPEIIEDDEFEEMEDDGLEDVEEEVAEEAPAPKPKRKGNTEALKKAAEARAASAPKFGSAQLAAHITEVTGETYDARNTRMLLRKLAADGTLARVVGETRDRYSFEGPEDPIVVAVVTMVKDGTAKQLRQAGLEKVKKDAEEKRAARKAAKEAAKAAKEAEPAEDEEFEEAEDDEVEDEVEEAPKPAPKRRTTAAKPAAPAKAAPRKATARTKA